MRDITLFGIQLSRIMEEHSLSLSDVARTMKCNWRTVRNLIKPVKSPKQVTMRKLKEFIKKYSKKG